MINANSENLVPLYVYAVDRSGTMIVDFENAVRVPDVLVDARNARKAAKQATGWAPLSKDEAGSGERFCESGSGKRAAFVIPVKVPNLKSIHYGGAEGRTPEERTILTFRDGTKVSEAEFSRAFRAKVQGR